MNGSASGSRWLIDITPVIDNRGALQAQSAVGDAPAVVRGLNGGDIANCTGGNVIAVIIVAADFLVQLQKLPLGDGAKLRASNPYWTPTLSIGRRANPVAGSRPNTFTK